VKRFIHKVFGELGYKISSADHWDSMVERSRDGDILRALMQMDGAKYRLEAMSLARKSRAQLFQDLAYIALFGAHQDGYFVEAGGADGIVHSNSYLFEKELGWSGLIGEPSSQWHRALEDSRSCHVERRALARKTGDLLLFSETRDPLFSGASHTGDSITAGSIKSKVVKTYEVGTVSLVDSLNAHRAPEIIDFISLDTEGGELEILKGWHGEKYQFKFVSIEHNYRSDRAGIVSFMRGMGYQLVFENISRFDYWFVGNQFVNEIG
jgi:FkbM family methyltransferase